MTNKKLGNDFEQEFCETLAAQGFWAHNLTQNASGQPADVIAVRGNYHTLIDCKVVSTDRGFVFSRVEDNQRNAMSAFHSRGWQQALFALKLPNGEIRMLEYVTILGLESKGIKSIPLKNIKKYTVPFDVWLEVAK